MAGINDDPEYDVLISGTLSALNDTLVFESANKTLQGVRIDGTWVGTVSFEVTVDGTNWDLVNTLNQTTLSKLTSTISNGIFLIISAGFAKSRVRLSSYTSGSVSVSDIGSDATSVVYSLQADTWKINAAVPTNDAVSIFNSVSAVTSSTLTSVVTYTVPPLKKSYLIRVPFSGQNVAQYQLFKNASVIDNQWTYFGGNLSGGFDFSSQDFGLPLVAGDVISLKVTHVRPFVADFNGRIFYIEMDV